MRTKISKSSIEQSCERTTGFTTMQVKCIGHSILFFISGTNVGQRPQIALLGEQYSDCFGNYMYLYRGHQNPDHLYDYNLRYLHSTVTQ